MAGGREERHHCHPSQPTPAWEGATTNKEPVGEGQPTPSPGVCLSLTLSPVSVSVQSISSSPSPPVSLPPPPAPRPHGGGWLGAWPSHLTRESFLSTCTVHSGGGSGMPGGLALRAWGPRGHCGQLSGSCCSCAGGQDGS